MTLMTYMQQLPNLHVQSKLNPIRFTCSNTLFHLRDSVSQTELILLPPNLLAPWIFPVSLPQPAWLSTPKNLDTHPLFLSYIRQSDKHQVLPSCYFNISQVCLLFSICPPHPMSTSPNDHLLVQSYSHNLQLDSLYSLLLPSSPFQSIIFYANLTMSLPSYNPSMISKCPENRVQMP